MNILLITVRADFGGGPRHVHQLIEELPSDFNIYVAFPQGKPYGLSFICICRYTRLYKIR